MVNDKYFKTDSYLIRSSILETQTKNFVNNIDFLEHLKNDQMFLEQLFFANSSLYYQLLKYYQGNIS
ncbi:hypothetical protein, partial [Streptococcus suis]